MKDFNVEMYKSATDKLDEKLSSPVDLTIEKINKNKIWYSRHFVLDSHGKRLKLNLCKWRK